MNLQKILRWIVIGGIFLLPFIPLIVSSNLFFPFITGKNFAFRIIIEIIFGSWIILAFMDKEYRPKFSWIGGAFVAFLIFIGISDLLSSNPYKSFWSNFERMEGYVTLLHLFAYFVVISSTFVKENLWKNFVNTAIGVSVTEAIYGIFQVLGFVTINQGGVRLDGTFGNASYMAVYMLFFVFITAFMMIRHAENKFFVWGYRIAIVLQLISLYFTETRGAFVGLIAGILLTFFLIAFLGRKEYKNYAKTGVWAFLAVVIIVGGLFAFKDSSFVKNSSALSRLTSISISDATPRFMVWDMALQGFKERPIFGWGQESFNYVFNKYYDPKMYAQEPWFDRAHDIFFDWLIAGGLLGLISYLSLFVTALYYVWRKTEGDIIVKSIFTGLLVAYLIQNIFVFDNIVTYILFFSVLAYVHNKISRMPVTVENFKVSEEISKYVVAPIIIVLSIFVVYVVNIKSILASGALIGALSNQSEGITKNIEYFNKAYSYKSFGDSEITEQLTQFAANFSVSQTSSDLKEEIFTLAKQKLENQIDVAPQDARYEFFIGSLLSIYGKYDESNTHLNKALELSPNKQSIMFQLGSNFLSTKKYSTALDIFKRAFDLAPEYDEARIIYAVGGIYAGNNSLVEKLLIPKYGTVLIPNSRISSAYFNTKQYQKVVTITETAIKNDPTVSQNYIDLATVYSLMGMNSKVVSTLQKLAEIKPEMSEKINAYIKQLNF